MQTLCFNPEEAVATLIKKDKKLALVIERAGPFKLKPTAMVTPFAALGEAIVHQQLTGKASATITRRLCELHGGSSFPLPEQLLALSDDSLRAVGLSRNKIAALRDLAEKTIEGRVPGLADLEAMSDEEIVDRLVSVRGIGRWTVEMLLIFKLGRPDVLPVHDYGVRKGFALTYRTRELPTPAEVTQKGERWRPFRTVASWYMWRAVDLSKQALT